MFLQTIEELVEHYMELDYQSELNNTVYRYGQRFQIQGYTEYLVQLSFKKFADSTRLRVHRTHAFYLTSLQLVHLHLSRLFSLFQLVLEG